MQFACNVGYVYCHIRAIEGAFTAEFSVVYVHVLVHLLRHTCHVGYIDCNVHAIWDTLGAHLGYI